MRSGPERFEAGGSEEEEVVVEEEEDVDFAVDVSLAARSASSSCF